MKDWPATSNRTRAYLAVAVPIFCVGAVAGILSSDTLSVYDYVCDLSLLALLAMSFALICWSALQNPRRSLARAAWLCVAAGFAVAIAAAGDMARIDLTSTRLSFDGASPFFTLALCLLGAGLWLCAYSLGDPARDWRLMGQALTVASAVFCLMMVALLAPGPSMPFSTGSRDGGAIVRLLLDSYLLLLPVVYATARQLVLPRAHRSRIWVAASAGVLMICMGDAVNPLVDLDHGQIYPAILWCLGFIMLTVAASLSVDFERAEMAERPGALVLSQGTEPEVPAG